MQRYLRPAVLALCASVSCPCWLSAQDRLSSAVDATVSAQLSARRARAAAVAIVAGDRVVFAKGYGEANPGTPVDPSHTLFRIASVSKVFVAAAAAQLSAQHRLDLHADIRQYLSDVPVANPFPEPVTTARLLTHTSGMADSFLGALASDPAALMPLREFFKLHPPEIVERPGTGFAYSNLGIALAGAVIEAVVQRPFDQFAQTDLLGPLGMTRATFHQPPPAILGSALADGRGRRQPPLIVPYPAGSLVATVTDIGRFLIAQLNGGVVDGTQALLPDAIALAHAHHWGDPRAQGVGYGWFESRMRGERALFHTGDGGHHGLLWMIPSRRIGLYVVYSTGDAGALELREEVARAALDALDIIVPRDEEPPAAGSEDSLGVYSGWYGINGVTRRTFEHVRGLATQVHIVAVDGRMLRISPPGFGPPITARRIDADLFATSDGGTIAFTRDGAGRPTELTLTGSIWDPQGFHRLAWWDIQILTLAICVGAAVLMLVRVVIAVTSRWVRRGQTTRRMAAAGWRLSGMLPLLALAVPATAVAGILLSPPPYVRVPPGARIALALLTVCAAIGAALPVFIVAVWREPAWRALTRWFYALYAIWMLAFAWTLYHWTVVLGYM